VALEEILSSLSITHQRIRDLLAAVGVGVLLTAALMLPAHASPADQAPTEKPSAEPVGVTEETFDGIIAGQLVDGTADAVHPDLSGVLVTLYPLVNQSLETPITTTSGADGSFRFEGLGTGADREYDVSARYQGIEYFADAPVRFSEPGQTLHVTVTVYETTTAPNQVVLERTHLIMDFVDSQTLQVSELHILQNRGDRTFIGAPVPESSGVPVTLGFSLPSGATGLRFEDPRMEVTVIRTADGFLDTLPVAPGGRRVLFSYTVPYKPPEFRFARRMAYTSNNLNVLVRDVGIKVTVPGLTEGQPREAGAGVRYLNFVGQNVSQGQELVVEFEGTPQLAASPTSVGVTPPAGGLSQDLLRWGAVVLGIIGGVLAVGYAVLRGRPAPAGVMPPRAAKREHLARREIGVPVYPMDRQARQEDLERLRQELLVALARLDDAHEAGQIPEAEYLEERALTKAQLIEVMRRLQGGGERGA